MIIIKTVWYAIVAILRLTLISVIMFLNGLNQILFNHGEVVNVSLVIKPYGLAKDTLSYIDSLLGGNADLASKGGPASLPADAFDDSKFQPDEYYEDEFDDDEEDDEEFWKEIDNMDIPPAEPKSIDEPKEPPKKKRGRPKKKKDDDDNNGGATNV